MVVDLHLLISVVISLFCNEIVVSLVEICNSVQKISTKGLKSESHAEAMPSSSAEVSWKVRLVPPPEFHSWLYHTSGGTAGPTPQSGAAGGCSF